MIPKIIHYCWFGGKPLPANAKKCIASWRKYLPDYEIKEWNESNFDVNIIPYTAEAYKVKKYAFVSDYARFWILYKFGGLYFDTDVEIIQNMDCIIAKGPFMGCENEVKIDTLPIQLGVNPGLGLGANPKLDLLGEILSLYRDKHYILANGSFSRDNVVTITTELLCQYGLKSTTHIQNIAGIFVYPKKYFCPKDYTTGKIKITKDSYSIHWYGASWASPSQKIKRFVWKMLIGLGLDKIMRQLRTLQKNGREIS